jgi:hypothetical protein
MRAIRRFGLMVVLTLGMSSGGWAQTNSALLEKGIYAEETLGNLWDAINIYLQIVGNTDAARPVAAQALYRLGICYLKSGNRADAQAAFSKLTRSYPEQKELIAAIPGLPIPAEVQLRPTPWQDGEVMEFVESTKAGGDPGHQTLRVDAAEEDGRKAWHFEWITVPGNAGEIIGGGFSNIMLRNVVADAGSLAPISSSIIGRGINAHARFLSGHAQIQPSKRGAPGDIPLTKNVYDEAQIFQYIRRLPFADGLQITVPLFSILDGAVTETRLLVEGREKIAVPAGTLDCYRVLISRGARGVANEQTVWITADSHAYIAKVSFSEDYGIELASVHPALKDGSYEEENPSLGFKLWVPAGWQFYSIPGEGNSNAYGNFVIIAPELKAECSLRISTLKFFDASSPNVAADVKRVLGLRAQNLQSRGMRGEQVIQISGFPALRVITDYRRREISSDLRLGESGDEMVDYYVVFYTGTRQVELSMEAEKSVFEEMRPVFDSIVNGLRFK